MKRCLIAFLLAPALTGGGENPPAPSEPGEVAWFSEEEPFDFSIEGSIQGSWGSHAFWGLAQTFSPASNYPTDHQWLESYVKPGFTFATDPIGSITWFGGAAVVASGTAGTDVFEAGDVATVLPEEAYLGVRFEDPGSPFGLEFSAGQQRYTIGNEFLISVGAGNGFERGSVTLFPYRAWEMAALGKLTWNDFSLEGFFLDPNELESANSHNQLAGLNLKWEPAEGQNVGFAYVRAVESEYPYPVAPIGLIPNGREGLDAYDAYWKFAPVEGPLAGFSLLGEIVVERNESINLESWGGGLEAGYRWSDLPFAPRLSYSPRYFSGDDPATVGTNERFDPLYYMASPDTWSSGGNGSLALLNSNLVAQRVRLELALSDRDFLNLNYWYVQAAETFSPIQFGQAARPVSAGGSPVIVSGVPDDELAHEIYLEYVRMMSPNLYLTVGVAGSFPGEGIRRVATAGSHDWWGGLLNVTFRY